MSDIARSRAARAAAEHALVSVVHHYGGTPEFVLLGGLVPELLCTTTRYRHAGTSDVDIQVDLEIACGAVNTKRLEQALGNAGFTPDDEGRAWRWYADEDGAAVKFELLADLDTAPNESVITFDDCEHLGAANLRGTGYASRDVHRHTITSRAKGDRYTAEVNVTGVAGFLLAKAAAARGRRAEKDHYDIAYVLLHNDHGGHLYAVDAVRDLFVDDLQGPLRTTLDELAAAYIEPGGPGPVAYANQIVYDHADADLDQAAADAVIAVTEFHAGLYPPASGGS